jgi:glycosyltransferase involved in cell wall biosynthesis
MSPISPLVSVIVPTRNSDGTLEACLESIRSQTFKPIELIVVDNQSSDRTIQIATALADVVMQRGPERSAQRNWGARAAKGHHLLFIDSDMRLQPDVVGDCVEAARASGLPAVVIPEYSFGRGFLARCRALERSFYVGDDQIEAARFFTRQAFEASEGFDETLTGPEDWDLSRRLAAGRRLPRTASFIAHDEESVQLRSILAKKRYYARSFVLYWRKHGPSAAAQANLILRPAILRNWRSLLQHPILAAGVLSLKTLEMGAAGLGLCEGWVDTRPASNSRRVSR